MKNEKIVLSKIAHLNRLKSFRTSAELILTTFILVVAAATTVATAQTYTDLHNFSGPDGKNSSHPDLLAQGRDGSLYGTTTGGGTGGCPAGCGVAFKITPSGTLKVLFDFDDFAWEPCSGLTLGTDGNFYGTTTSGSASGTIFKITKSGSRTILYNFTGGADGGAPVAPPIQGTDRNFYGTTPNGTAYKVTPFGTFTLLGSIPFDSEAPLLQGADGNFYGTTGAGGSSNNCNPYGCGTFFRMTSKGAVTIVYNFDSTHGRYPSAPVIQASNGIFYGTTVQGGTNGMGVMFKLTTHGAITVLHNFPDPNYPNDGQFPTALVAATDGNLYGVTTWGGATSHGVIFRFTPAGAYSILYNFDRTHGANPESTPMQHTNGKIYGLASGGTHGKGVVYSFDLGLGPFVSLVSTSGKVGKTIEILGQGFTGTSAVSFNGTAATFTVVSDTYLTTTVPGGATTGFVTVTTPGGTLKSNKQFTVKP